jgi:hypothetical protein
MGGGARRSDSSDRIIGLRLTWQLLVGEATAAPLCLGGLGACVLGSTWWRQAPEVASAPHWLLALVAPSLLALGGLLVAQSAGFRCRPIESGATGRILLVRVGVALFASSLAIATVAVCSWPSGALSAKQSIAEYATWSTLTLVCGTLLGPEFAAVPTLVSVAGVSIGLAYRTRWEGLWSVVPSQRGSFAFCGAVLMTLLMSATAAAVASQMSQGHPRDVARMTIWMTRRPVRRLERLGSEPMVAGSERGDGAAVTAPHRPECEGNEGA